MSWRRKKSNKKRPKVVIKADKIDQKLEWPEYWPIPRQGDTISFDNIHFFMVQHIRHLRLDGIEEIIIFCNK